MMPKLERIASIENLADRKIYFMSLLTREAEKRNVQPVVVGGSAVEFYTEGIYPSYDIDLVGNRRIIGEILEETFDFEPSGRHWINEQIGLYVEIPSSHLAGDKNKITTIRVENQPVYVLGLEDLIIDRIKACVYWESRTDYEQARFLLRQYKNRLDFEYLEKKTRAEGLLRVLKRLLAGKPVWKMTAEGQKLWYEK